MDDRRLVGIELGITSAHTVRVLDGGGTTVRRRKAVPTVASLTEVEQAALAVLERYGTPQTLAAGPIRLARLIQGTSHGQQGAARAAQWLAAAQAALALYGDHPAVAVADLAAEVQTEVRLRRRHRPPDVFRAAGAGLSISGAPGSTRTCNLLPGPVVTLDVDAEAWLWAGSSSSCSLAYSSSGVISGSARTSNGWPADTNPTVAHWTDGAGRPG